MATPGCPRGWLSQICFSLRLGVGIIKDIGAVDVLHLLLLFLLQSLQFGVKHHDE